MAIGCLGLSEATTAQQRDLTWRGDLAVTYAQVTPDSTFDTTVNQNGNIAEITGGRAEGNNLFHSFQDFSVPTGNEAFFNNVEAIENIFSRVMGGNITLNIADNLVLNNESQISAEARGEANGGNIKINSDFVTAFPSQPNGSDIVARAEQGMGGNIEIAAESLFGIDRSETVAGNGTNNIDASSEFGLDSSVSIDVLDLEPTQELRELPRNLTDG